MELTQLINALQIATFGERETIAATAAQIATIEELKHIARLLTHTSRPVRLGALEIVRASRFRPALRVIRAFALERDGEERIFAARSMAHMATPSDRELLNQLAQQWIDGNDQCLRTHGARILEKITPTPQKPLKDCDTEESEQ